MKTSLKPMLPPIPGIGVLQWYRNEVDRLLQNDGYRE